MNEIGDLSQQLVRAAELLFASGVMQHSGHANMSARLQGERMLITAKGNIRGLTTADLAVVSFDGQVETGRIDPTTAEIVAMHAGVYRARKEAAAVIHTHSPFVTGFAVAHKPLPCAYEALLRFAVADDIPVADWAPRGSEQSVGNILAQLAKHPTAPAVLLANHGVLAFSRDPLQTAQLIIALEEAAQATLEARVLGGEKPFPADALEREVERMKRFASGG